MPLISFHRSLYRRLFCWHCDSQSGFLCSHGKSPSGGHQITVSRRNFCLPGLPGRDLALIIDGCHTRFTAEPFDAPIDVFLRSIAVLSFKGDIERLVGGDFLRSPLKPRPTRFGAGTGGGGFTATTSGTEVRLSFFANHRREPRTATTIKAPTAAIFHLVPDLRSDSIVVEPIR